MGYTYKKYRRKTTWADWLIAVIMIYLFYTPLHALQMDEPLEYLVINTLYFLVVGFLSVFVVMYLRYGRKYIFFTHQRFKNERQTLLFSAIFMTLVIFISHLALNTSYSMLYSDVALTFIQEIANLPLGIFTLYTIIYSIAWVLGYRNKYYTKQIRT
jgi:hypothetical protein